MKAVKDGVTVGIALQDFDGTTATTSAPLNGTEVKTGKILVFVNLGYSKLDSGTAQLAQGSPSTSLGTSAWLVDQASGKVNVNFFGDLNLNGNSILNVSKIIGMDGKWKIDESGNIVAESVTTRKLCLEEICIEKAQLKTLLQNAGLLPPVTEVSPPSPEAIPTTTATSTATSTSP